VRSVRIERIADLLSATASMTKPLTNRLPMCAIMSHSFNHDKVSFFPGSHGRTKVSLLSTIYRFSRLQIPGYSPGRKREPTHEAWMLLMGGLLWQLIGSDGGLTESWILGRRCLLGTVPMEITMT